MNTEVEPWTNFHSTQSSRVPVNFQCRGR